MPVLLSEEEVIRRNMGLAQEQIYTVEDVESMPEGEMVELIDGRLYYMAAPTARHQEIVTFLCWKIQSFLKNSKCPCRVYASPFAVFLNDDGYNYFMPDISVICDKDKMGRDGCHGAPDLIMEIVSKSSQSLDYMTKLFKYRAAGVKEYWIIDPLKKVILVYDFIGNQAGQFAFTDCIRVNIFEDFMLDFAELDEE